MLILVYGQTVEGLKQIEGLQVNAADAEKRGVIHQHVGQGAPASVQGFPDPQGVGFDQSSCIPLAVKRCTHSKKLGYPNANVHLLEAALTVTAAEVADYWWVGCEACSVGAVYCT